MTNFRATNTLRKSTFSHQEDLSIKKDSQRTCTVKIWNNALDREQLKRAVHP